MKKRTSKKTKSKLSFGKNYSNKESMKAVKEKTVKYSSDDIGRIEIIKDFLPPPEDLILKDTTIKVTLNLSKSSVDFFKDLAEKHGSQYQKIIRLILDSYSSNYIK